MRSSVSRQQSKGRIARRERYAPRERLDEGVTILPHQHSGMKLKVSSRDVMPTWNLSGPSSPCQIERITYFCSEGALSRNVVTRSRVRPTGKYPSWKMERMLEWESRNELHAFRLLDCDPSV